MIHCLKITYCVAIMLLSSVTAIGQLSFEHNYAMLPACGRAATLRNVNWNTSDSFVYVFHFHANSCPRCEGAMYHLAGKLQDAGLYTALIFDNDQIAICQEYMNVHDVNLKRFNKVLLDTGHYFRQFVDFSKTTLNVPFLYKINRQAGVFCGIYPMLGIKVNEQLLALITGDTTTLKCKETSQYTMSPSRSEGEGYVGLGIRFSLQRPDQSALGTVVGVLRKDGIIAAVGYDDGNVYLFDSNGHNLGIISPDSTEYFCASQPSFHYKISSLKSSGILRVIYLSVNDLSRGRDGSLQVSITTSIPKVTVYKRPGDTDTIVEYDNKPVIVRKDAANTLKRIDPIVMPESSGTIGFIHQKYNRIGSDLYAVGILKGWPARGTTFNSSDSANANPFTTAFYAEKPMWALHDTAGRLLGKFGRLARLKERLHLGYYYGGSRMFDDGRYCYFADHFTGEVQRVSLQDIRKGENRIDHVYMLFPDKDTISKADERSFGNKMEYLNTYEERIMNKVIISSGSLDAAYFYAVVRDKRAGTIEVWLVDKRTDKSRTVFSAKDIAESDSFPDFKVERNPSGQLLLSGLVEHGPGNIFFFSRLVTL